MPLIHDDFLLQTATARKLYHEFAAGEPIYDYHCHLPPEDVARDRRFENLAEIWLGGDHYKWRAMRSNGVDEKFCTGDAAPYDKFLAFARTMPRLLRNPLYHWSHLELARYFDIFLPINEENARRIWDEANEKLGSPEFSARGILEKFKVAVVGTTDDPTDSLEHHIAFCAEQATGLTPCRTTMVPTFRPDRALRIDPANRADFKKFVDQLAAVSNVPARESYTQFVRALATRHTFFWKQGGRLSDHGLERCFVGQTDIPKCGWIFEKVLADDDLTAEETEFFRANVMLFTGLLDVSRGFTKQLHLGAMRNNNTELFKHLGRDIGCDSIGDYPQAEALSRFLDQANTENKLPQTVLYNLNPADNYVFATMIGNFQEKGRSYGKMQYGSGWWFLDQKEGMEAQLNALSQLGLLANFVGMLTDSRSLLSYCRHEYFRRILCNLLGREMETGELPDDLGLVGGMVRDISYRNAANYFGIAIHPAYAAGTSSPVRTDIK